MASVRKRGTKWQAQIRRRGFHPRAKSFSLRRDAERWATAQEREFDRLEAQGSQPTPLPSWTVTDLLTRYCDEVLPTKRSGRYEVYLIGALIRQSFAKKGASTLATADLARYMVSRLETVGPSIIRRELGVLSSAYETARCQWGYGGLTNPVRALKLPKAGPARTRRLTEEEAPRLSVSLKQSRNVWLHEVSMFALGTGMRLGEILALEWRDIDVDRCIATIRISKNGTSRIVPLSPVAISLLRGLPEASDTQVFGTSASAIKQAWRRAVRRAGISDLHFHDLRHEAISRFFEQGLSLPEVALISGHKDPRQLMRYTHLSAIKIARKLSGL